MTGAFIIEGQYDDDLNAFYGAGWTRTQPVLVINQLGVTPNLERVGPGRIDKGPDFSVNGRLQPHIKMRPGEVQMWRIINTSGRSGAFFAGPPKSDPTAKAVDPAKDFEWRQLAQDGVQLADANYQKSLDESFLMAAGNRVDLLVKAPTQPTRKSFDVLVQCPGNFLSAASNTYLGTGWLVDGSVIVSLGSNTSVTWNGLMWI
jgi:hypothetical protein